MMNTQARKSLPRAAPGEEFNDPRETYYGDGDIWQPQRPGGPGQTFENINPPADAIAERDRFLAGEGGAIPTAPAPKLNSIREYLQAMQPGQVPMFTNRPDSPMAQNPNAMVFEGDIGQGPGGPVNQPGAIPEEPPGDPNDQHVKGNDALDMAKERLKLDMPNIKQQFDESFGNSLSLDEYNVKWPAFVQHHTKELIKHYDTVLKDRNKSAIKYLDKFEKGSVAKYLKSGNIMDLKKSIDAEKISQGAADQYREWEEAAGKDDQYDEKVLYAKSQMEKFPDINSYVMSEIERVQSAMDDLIAAKTAKDQKARGGQEQAGAETLPPELQPRVEEAKNEYGTHIANGMGHAQAIAKIKEDYADIARWI